MADAEQSHLTTLTVNLLSAYVANNNIEHGDLSELIKSTHAALKVIESPESPAPVEPEYKPAVSVRKSLGSPTHIISMIDGKPYQTLKRHLSSHGLTPQEYKERYSLPRDYPMVAPAYSENRRAIAERLGLGRKVTGAKLADAAPAPASEPAPAPAKAVATPKPARKAKAEMAPAAASIAEAAKPARKPRAAPKSAEAKAAPSAKSPPAPQSGTRKRTAKTTPAS